MAMQKKFNDPFIFSLRVERKTREEILKRTNNMNDFINKAVKNELGKENKDAKGK